MIKTIQTHGLKTPGSTVALGRATLIKGPVGAGKSAISDAIQFAALGCVPRVGKNETATARLMRGDGMSVQLTLDDDRAFGRSLERKGGKLVNAADASWAPRKAKTGEVGDMIRVLFGASDDEAAQNLDIVRLLDRSGAELAKAIETLLDSGGLSVATRIARGVELIRERVDSQRATVDGLRQPTKPAVAAALERIAEAAAKQIEAGIVKALDWAGDGKREALASEKEARAALAGLEDRIGKLKVPAEGADTLRRRREEAVRRRTELRTQIDLVRQSAGERQAAEEAIGRAVDGARVAADAMTRAIADLTQVDGIRAAAEAIVDPAEIPAPAMVEVDLSVFAGRDEPIKSLRDQAVALDAEADALPAPQMREVDLSAWDERRAEAQRLRELADRLTAPAAPEAPNPEPIPDPIDTRKEWLDQHNAEVAVEKAKANPWREVEEIHAHLSTYGFECPGGPLINAKLFARLLELARVHGGDLAGLEAALAAAHEAHEAAKARAADREAERTAIAQRNAHHEFEHKAAVKVHERLVADIETERTRLRAQAKEIDETVRFQIQANQDLTRQVNASARAQHAAAVDERRAAARKLREDAATRKHLLDAEIDSVRADVLTENETARRNHRNAINDRRNAIEANAAERRRLTTEADRIVGAHRAAESQKAQADRSLAEAQARLAGLREALPIDVPAAETEIGSLDAEIGDLDARIEIVAQAATLQRELSRMAAEIERMTADGEVYAAAEWALKRLRDEDMRERAAGLEGRMQRFLTAAGREETPFLRCAKGAAEFGWRTPAGDEVSVEALSGGQSILYRAALAYAVVMSRAPELRLLLVELAEASDGTTEQAVLRSLQAVSDEVQVIVASCVPVEAPEGWTVIEVAARPQEVVA